MTNHETLRLALRKVQAAARLLQGSSSERHTDRQVDSLLAEAITYISSVLGVRMWPEPTTDPPDLETLEEWLFDGCCEATDGCLCEPDGICPHAHPSWLLRLGLI